jgi:hypothetical protein
MGRKGAAKDRAEPTGPSGVSTGGEVGGSNGTGGDSGLGPAVTAEFASDAGIGLQDLLGGTGGRARVGGGRPTSPTDAPAPVSPMARVEVDPRLIAKSLEMLDAMISAFADVEREPPEDMERLSALVKPLADYYASDSPSVTALWVMAGLGVGGYALTKYQRFRQSHPKPKTGDVLPMPDASGASVSTDAVATPPGSN